MTPIRRLAVALGLCASAFAISASTQAPPVEPTTVHLILGGPDTSALYHRDSCPLVQKGGSTVMSLKDARTRYFQPHCSCIVGRDAEPPCPPLAAKIEVAPKGDSSSPESAAKFIGQTTRDVIKMLGPPSLVQNDIWYYDKLGIRLRVANGRVIDPNSAVSSGTAAPTPSAPAPSTPAGATAQCRDGTYSYSKTRSGTCSGHGGVARWISG